MMKIKVQFLSERQSPPAKKPDFFIVGAPRCGTSAMVHYLGEHPDIYMARKEMHVFGSDLRFRNWFYRRGPKAYLDEFTVGLKDSSGTYKSWSVDNVKYKVDSPVEAHVDQFPKYTDADVHNLMAYLQTLR